MPVTLFSRVVYAICYNKRAGKVGVRLGVVASS